jgi:hypothetical protein
VNSPEHADRTEEMLLFESIIQGSFLKRILLIEGKSGRGKSVLMNVFASYCENSQIVHARVDFKGKPTIHEIFYNLCADLGWEYFPEFVKAVDQCAAPTNVIVTRNTLIGRNTIQIQNALQASSKEDRGIRVAKLTHAFFEDIRVSSVQRVFLFDTFNEILSEVEEWLRKSFLGEVRRIPSLIAVITGQIVPEQDFSWKGCAHHTVLAEIRDANAWYIYARRRWGEIPLDDIKTLCRYVTEPSTLDTALSSGKQALA